MEELKQQFNKLQQSATAAELWDWIIKNFKPKDDKFLEDLYKPSKFECTKCKEHKLSEAFKLELTDATCKGEFICDDCRINK